MYIGPFLVLFCVSDDKVTIKYLIINSDVIKFVSFASFHFCLYILAQLAIQYSYMYVLY